MRRWAAEIVLVVLVAVLFGLLWWLAQTDEMEVDMGRGRLHVAQMAQVAGVKASERAELERAELERAAAEQARVAAEELERGKAIQRAARAARVREGNGGGKDGAFWRALANCECASGKCGGPYIGYFQFEKGTAQKVGIDGSESYAEQEAGAREWASRIKGREGTSAGWPVCWWVALKGQG